MDRNGGKPKPTYQIKPLTKTEYLRNLVREIIAGVGDQEFTVAHVVRFVKDGVNTDCPFGPISSSLLYRVVSQEVNSMYDNAELERYVGGPPWVYVRSK